nr:gastrotropin=14 kDa bile acid binding protein [rats, ileal cytosol, Peptide Partial, 7 aa] [Rattus sp.]
RVSKRVA